MVDPPPSRPSTASPLTEDASASGLTDAGNTADVAKQQAAGVAQGAGEAGKQVAGLAKEQTQQVAVEAGQQAKQLLRRTEQEVSDQAGAQQRRLAAGMHAVGEELASMAKGLGNERGRD